MSEDAPNLDVATPTPVEAEFLERWKACVHQRDLDGLTALLAKDVVFRSPVTYRPYRGRSMVGFVLNLVAEVLPDLSYVNVYANGRGGVVLLFDASVADGDKQLELQGIDMIQLDEDGLVTELIVMIRPLRCLEVVGKQMIASFAAASGKNPST